MSATNFPMEKGSLSPARGILAGMLAGTAESIITVILTERIKTVLIEDVKSPNKLYRSEYQAFKLILHTEGLQGMYRGLVSKTTKQASTSGIKMCCCNVLKGFELSEGLQQSGPSTFVTGALSGVFTVYLTQPFDTIKTRTQRAHGESMGELVRSILQESGVRGFWSGSTSRLGRLVFSTSIVYEMYEKVSNILATRMHYTQNEPFN